MKRERKGVECVDKESIKSSALIKTLFTRNSFLMNCLTNTIHINSVMSILFVCYLYDRVTEDMGKPSGGDGVLTPMKSLMNITGNIVFGPIRYFQWILPSIFADLSFYLLYSQSPITLYS